MALKLQSSPCRGRGIWKIEIRENIAAGLGLLWEQDPQTSVIPAKLF